MEVDFAFLANLAVFENVDTFFTADTSHDDTVCRNHQSGTKLSSLMFQSGKL